MASKKKCARCKELLSLTSFASNGSGLRAYCKECNSARSAEKYKENPDYFRNNNLLRNYGISAEEYEILFQCQGGVCAICGSTDSKNIRTLRLAVDHSHETGLVRGLLCTPCNTVLGLVDDKIDLLAAMIAYVRSGGFVGREVDKSQTN